MYAHGKADDVDCFLNVRFPIAAFLGVVDAFDEDIVVFFTVRVDEENQALPAFSAPVRKSIMRCFS